MTDRGPRPEHCGRASQRTTKASKRPFWPSRAFRAWLIMRLGSGRTAGRGLISTGSIALISALGVGGSRRPNDETFGPESSGKTTLCQHILPKARQGV